MPAGDYARRWLRDLAGGAHVVRQIELPHVRAVLAAVQTGACPLGVVYATDTRDRELHTVGQWAPTGEVGPLYAWAAVTESPRAEAAREVLRAAVARHDVFRAHGFVAAAVGR